MDLLNAKDSKPLQGGPSYSARHRLFRAVWNTTWLLLAAWTPAPLHFWRTWLLNLFGAQVHPTAHVYGSARIWYPPNLVMGASSCLGPFVNCYCMAPVRLEQGAIVSQGTHLCTGMHDIDDPEFQLVVKPIKIGLNAWVAAEGFVGPGVSIGTGAVLGARAVIFRDAEEYGVYAGNPARMIRRRYMPSNEIA